MKNLIFINGTMGAGKTTVSSQLNNLLPASIWLDGDWCWNANPFVVTDETKEMVTDNIVYILNNFIRCSRYENIIFCWVMDYEYIYQSIAGRLDTKNCNIFRFTLTCSPSQLKKYIENDTNRDKRDYEKSLERLGRFETLDTVKINTDNMSPLQIATAIKNSVFDK